MCKIVYNTYNTYGKAYTEVKHCTLAMLPEIKGNLERKGCMIVRITSTVDVRFH